MKGLLLLLFAGHLISGEINLSYKFQPGQVFKYQSISLMRMTTRVGNQARTMRTKTTLLTSQRVDSIIEDSIIVLSLKIDKIEIETKPEIPISGIGEIQGKEVKLRITESGKVLKMEGAEQLSMMGQPGEKTLEGYIKSFFDFLPDHPVKPKDIWEKKVEDEEGTLKGRYTLTGFEEREGIKCAKIKAEQELMQEQTQEQMGNKIHTKIKGKSKGEIYFGVGKSILIYRTITFSLEGEQEISRPSVPEPMTLPIYIDQAQEIKLLPEE